MQSITTTLTAETEPREAAGEQQDATIPAPRRRGRPPVHRTPEEVAAAAADRAARKKARLAEPAPEENPAYSPLSLDELRRIRSLLGEEETRVSYWRRLIQARLDLLETDELHEDPIQDISRVLTEAQTSHQRIARVTVGPVEGPPPLPDLASLWAVVVDTSDEASVASHREALQSAERTLSEYRKALHKRIDEATGQLIARYRRDPMLALSALPGADTLFTRAI